MSDIRPDSARIPRHVAMIMDGNGRWAKKRHLPRIAGHRAGVTVVENVVRLCGQRGIEVLTLFAFSSENWRRPAEEVGLLMGLFVSALEHQVNRLHDNNVRLITELLFAIARGSTSQPVALAFRIAFSESPEIVAIMTNLQGGSQGRTAQHNGGSRI